MTDPFANRGFKMLTGTSAIDISTSPLGGLTPLSDVVVAAINYPTCVDGFGAYSGDSALVGKTLQAGVFYPIACITSIQFSTNTGGVIGWLMS